MEPKDRIEEGMPPLDLEDDGYYADSENFVIDDLYPEDDPEMDYYGLDDIFDDIEGLDESDLY